MKSFESGIDYQYIHTYLHDELALEKTGASTYRYKQAELTLTPLPPRKVGSFNMQRNRVDMRGDPDDIAEFEHMFLMRFLSAGG